MTTVKPSKNEEEYFAKQEVDKAERLSKEFGAKYKNEEKQKMKDLHFMHCSKCGMELQSITFQGFILEKCFHCGVYVLDEDEFEKLAGREEGFLSSIVGLFK